MTSQEIFINSIAPLIRTEANKRGYKVASPVIAQACLESNYGASSLASKYHNYFGLKCGSSWRGKSVNLSTKEEYKQGTLTTIRDNFRVYDSIEEGVKGYFDFIATKRYANLKGAKTPNEYLTMIRADGYATSFSYVTNNMNVVKKWNLTKWDDIYIENPTVNPYPETSITLKEGSSGKAVQYLQWILKNKAGYGTLTIDGIFGSKTKEVVTMFQERTNLTKDGIVGPKTWQKLKML